MDQLDLFADAEEIPATFVARTAVPRPAAAPRPASAPRPVVAAAEPDSLFADPHPELPAVQVPIPTRRGIAPLLIGNHRDAGQRLGEAVADTWHASNWGGYRMDIPVSIVAALALFPIKGHIEDVTRIISTCTDWELLQGYREVYAATWSSRPDLGARMVPLMGWLTEDGVEEKAYAVRRVTDTALKYGVLQMTGDRDPWCRSDTDLMSWTITSLRSHGARQGMGEYHTPPEVCDMMARVIVDEPPEKGKWFHEPAGGTGGMFRALAQHLRDLNADPADYVWAINDLDPLAAAGAAVNAIVWGLGPNVVVSCGDALRQGDVVDQAMRERAALIEERDQIVGYLATVEAYSEAIKLADRLMSGAKAV
ncbi:N-6 DNA methylase [Streptomyces sp. NPDC048211]|uniref:N-6 DNA methylase n=1 Tax=Streptomyces sp. NPDC048211 TaxID=3365516 RepID=UPI003717FC29